MTSLFGIDQAHAAVAAIDTSFQYSGCSRLLHDWHDQKHSTNQGDARNAKTTYEGDVHKGLLPRRRAALRFSDLGDGAI